MVEGTAMLDHDGMEANNRYVSIRLTDMVHYHRVILVKNIEISAYGGKKMCKGSQAYI